MAVAGQVWEEVIGVTDSKVCQWIPQTNEWQSAVEAGCFAGEVHQPAYSVDYDNERQRNITSEKECVTGKYTIAPFHHNLVAMLLRDFLCCSGDDGGVQRPDGDV